MLKHEIDQRTDVNGINRRHFLKVAGISALGISSAAMGNFKGEAISVIIHTDDPIAGSPPVRWATKELEQSLIARGITVRRFDRLTQAPNDNVCIVVADTNSSLGRQLLKEARITVLPVPEALALAPVKSDGKKIVLTCANDERGLVYALLELSDRVQHAPRPLDSLDIQKPVVEQPANIIRSLNRLFVSDVEDKPWYNDREMWPQYLTMVATQRFNRFNLSFGIGYDFLQKVTDGYFLFAYPFLLSVPGYNVRVPQLPDAERDKNLEMLKFISEQTVARGIQFQLGIWMHGYEWLNSPNPNYTIEGLTPQTHGPYCRDAVRELLKACPAISGITFRVHGESGVNEGSYDFWRKAFEGLATCGRKVEIDMHAKGMDQAMIDAAVATGMPVNISPKYWAEHIGMPYHQADIRGLEIPKPGKATSRLMNLSAGSRSFIRYGYGDLLKEDRQHGVLHRIWPGTQRLLLWGDPVTGAAQAKAFSFCGSKGVELMEPLSFKGRRGTGIAGDRCGYADASLKPRWDWEKYLYSLRIFGRLAYNPNAEPDVWRRYLRKEFGAAAERTELALANATRILPIVLTAHGASAGNNTYWPEMYTNQPICDSGIKHPYSDTPSPKIFGNVSPLDPQLFIAVNDFAAELLKPERSGKYSPIEAAQWLEDYADEALKQLTQAEAQSKKKSKPEFRRMAIDVAMQAGLGRFFAAKFRSGVLYALFEQTGDRTALEEALKAYHRARSFWAELANRARNVYQPDVTVGDRDHLRGHWSNRLPAIDEDIASMTQQLDQTKGDAPSQQKNIQLAIREALGRPNRTAAACSHVAPEHYRPGQPLHIELSFERTPKSARLYYRHVNQAERYETVEMQTMEKRGQVMIPAAYTNSHYPIQYYFELKGGKAASLYPGFNKDLTNQPYFVAHPS
jgi:hypothetical protein